MYKPFVPIGTWCLGKSSRKSGVSNSCTVWCIFHLADSTTGCAAATAAIASTMSAISATLTVEVRSNEGGQEAAGAAAGAAAGGAAGGAAGAAAGTAGVVEMVLMLKLRRERERGERFTWGVCLCVWSQEAGPDPASNAVVEQSTCAKYTKLYVV